MFTVKAEVWNDAGPNSYDLFQSETVRVEKCRVAGANGHGQPAYIAPEIEVWLGDGDNVRRKCLYVGEALDHYCSVFVMNERGKTIQVIQPGNANRPINVPKEIAA